MTDTVTNTEDIEESMTDLLDALLKEQAQQAGLIEQMRRDLSSAQVHSNALMSEAERIARALLTLRGVKSPQPDALIADRQSLIARGAD